MIAGMTAAVPDRFRKSYAQVTEARPGPTAEIHLLRTGRRGNPSAARATDPRQPRVGCGQRSDTLLNSGGPRAIRRASSAIKRAGTLRNRGVGRCFLQPNAKKFGSDERHDGFPRGTGSGQLLRGIPVLYKWPGVKAVTFSLLKLRRRADWQSAASRVQAVRAAPRDPSEAHSGPESRAKLAETRLRTGPPFQTQRPGQVENRGGCRLNRMASWAAGRGVAELAAGLGFEPRQNDPESFVLPLHHPAV